MANDELASEVSRPVDGEGAAPDEELIPGRLGQLENDLLPPGQNWHDPGRRLPDPHEGDAVSVGDILCGDPPPVDCLGPRLPRCLACWSEWDRAAGAWLDTCRGSDRHGCRRR